MTKIHNLKILVERRKNLRKNQTPQENKLWWYLRQERLGIKFRRQHSIGGYILDFYCPKKKLIIEVDGGIHLTYNAKENDKIRDKFFTDLGFMVLRFSNEEIENSIKSVISKIEDYLV